MPNLWLKDADGDFINLDSSTAIKHDSSRDSEETSIYVTHVSGKTRQVYMGLYKETTLIMQNIERQLQKRGVLITLLDTEDDEESIGTTFHKRFYRKDLSE